jgi:hypothetical protein
VASNSVGELPAPAPSAHRLPSIWRAPASYAAIEFAIPSERFWCPWKPTCADLGHQRRHPVGHVAGQQPAGGVDDVHALAAGVDHDPGLRGQRVGVGAVREHQEADGFQTEVAGHPEMLDRHVGLRAVGRDPHDRGAGVARLVQVGHGADAGQEQDGDPGVARHVDRRGHQVDLVGVREAVVERRAGEAVAVSDLDDGHAGLVQRARHGPYLIDRELVGYRVAAVAQGGVGDPNGRGAHRATAPWRCVISSPTRTAAAVMMSRFPAHGGR